jgi:hypothetical protein
MPWRHTREWRYNTTILDLTLDRGEFSVSRPCHFTPGERVPSTHLIGGWVRLRSPSGRCRQEKSLALSGIKPGQSSLTELSWLLVNVCYIKMERNRLWMFELFNLWCPLFSSQTNGRILTKHRALIRGDTCVATHASSSSVIILLVASRYFV